MFRRFKIILTSLALLLCMMPSAAAFAAPASGTDIFKGACQGTGSSSPVCQTTGKDPITGKNGVLYKVNVVLALVAGVSAVVVFIIGGFLYVTAGGDAGKAKSARTAMISATVGLLVIGFAELFIALVINIVT